MSSVSAQILQLCDPAPNSVDLDWFDDNDKDCAKLCDYNEADDVEPNVHEGGLLNRSSLRRPAFESDPRYAGKTVSRKALDAHWEISDGTDEEWESDNTGSEEEDLESVLSEGAELDSPVREGLNNMSSNEDEPCLEQDECNSDSSVISAEDIISTKESVVDMDSIEEDLIISPEDVAGNLKESVAEDIEKGKAVKNQISIWDGLLECRIRLQKVLPLVNRLPQGDMVKVFEEQGKELISDRMKHSHSELTKLLDNLLQLQKTLFSQNSTTKHVINGSTDQSEAIVDSCDEEIPSDFSDNDASDVDTPIPSAKPTSRKSHKKRKSPKEWETSSEEYIDNVHQQFAQYRNDTITKWNEKLKLASGKMTSKAFLHYDRSVMDHVNYVLQDKQRLRKRTQLKRSSSSGKVLGQGVTTNAEKKMAFEENKESAPVKDYDEEVFDDDDFYHQLLKELIDRKTSQHNTNDPIEMGRQWLELQKLRTNVKRKIDTKASKGRKLRYKIHQKLTNFMTPVDTGGLSNTARNDLFSSLFGSRGHQQDY